MIIALILANHGNNFGFIIRGKIMGVPAAKKGLHYGDISQKVGKRLLHLQTENYIAIATL